eukprot:scaffold2550_cov153-Skeletonema_menzelii.AAC.13
MSIVKAMLLVDKNTQHFTSKEVFQSRLIGSSPVSRLLLSYHCPKQKQSNYKTWYLTLLIAVSTALRALSLAARPSAYPKNQEREEQGREIQNLSNDMDKKILFLDIFLYWEGCNPFAHSSAQREQAT